MSIVALLIAASVQAQPATLAPDLQPLAFLAGSCWRGTFPDGRQTDTHCFTAMFGGRFLRDRHVVAGARQPYSGETLYRWDATGRQIRFDYYASDGSHSAGIAIPAENGLSFPEIHRAADGTESAIRTLWTREGADAYLVTSEMRSGESWRTLLRMRMERLGAAPAD